LVDCVFGGSLRTDRLHGIPTALDRGTGDVGLKAGYGLGDLAAGDRIDEVERKQGCQQNGGEAYDGGAGHFVTFSHSAAGTVKVTVLPSLIWVQVFG